MKTYIPIILLFIPHLLHGQSEQINNIPRIEQAATIDGSLTDDVWNSIQPFTGFYDHFPNDTGLTDNQTEVKLYHDGRMLYIGAVYHDSESRNNISTLKRDLYREVVLLSDCFGVALDPYNNGDSGYLFALNAKGVQFDGLIGNASNLNSSWSTIWSGKATQQGNDKFYEIAIPLDAINFNAGDQAWGIQLFVNDTKINLFSTLKQSPRNFTQYDLRYTQQVQISQLPSTATNKFSALPSVSYNTTTDIINDVKDSNWTPSLDAQYNITPSLRLDMTLNPDFSQVEVDQQVTNLTRFAVNFPERRKFFLENSDLFSNLGTWSANPFYSRRIGSQSDIAFGAKLSGNISNNTRIGLLNAQTKAIDDIKGSNYTIAVGRHNFSNLINGSAYLINTQNTSHYNRVLGSNLSYRSENNKWVSSFNYSKSLTSDISGSNNFISGTIEYDTPELIVVADYENAGSNYIAESGFVPYQHIYDASAQQTIREAYSKLDIGFQIKHYPKESKNIDWKRRIWVRNTSIFNEDNSLRSTNVFWSPFAIRFKDRSYVYLASSTSIDNPRYSFDFLQNGNLITPGKYTNTFVRTGYWSPTNKRLFFATKLEYGSFYGGTRFNPFLEINYRMLPTAVLSLEYSINDVRLGELGQRTFHLTQLKSEVYLNNQLNWTTYLQYNTQANNFNVNSRVQWEYKPLSYVYLVFTNNYNNDFENQNWGISLKVNRRLDF